MDFGLIKLDKDSRLLWAYPGACHHDLFVDQAGLALENLFLQRKVRALETSAPAPHSKA